MEIADGEIRRDLDDLDIVLAPPTNSMRNPGPVPLDLPSTSPPAVVMLHDHENRGTQRHQSGLFVTTEVTYEVTTPLARTLAYDDPGLPMTVEKDILEMTPSCPCSKSGDLSAPEGYR